MSSMKLEFIINAIDRATKPLGLVASAVHGLAAPVERVKWAYGQLTGAMSAAAQAGAAAAAVGGAAFYGFKRIADAVDGINDSAAALGMTTQRFQQMGYAAQMSGADAGEMSQALVFLNKNMGEARSGSKDMTAWFDRVGVSLKDLRNPSFTAGDAVERMADTFHKAGDAGSNAGKKIEASTALMGRGGFRMIQMLNGGSKAIREMYGEADRLGVTLGDGTVRAMTSFNDSWDRLRLTMFGALASVGGVIAPMLQGVVERLVQWTVVNRQLIATRVEAFVNRITSALPGFLRGLSQVENLLSGFASGADTVARALGGWPNILAMLAGVIGAKLVFAVYSLTTAMAALAAASWANPLIWIAASVMALIAAIPLLVMHWDKLIERLHRVNEAMPAWIKGNITGPVLGAVAGATSGPQPEGSWSPKPEGSWAPKSELAVPPSLPTARQSVDVGGTLTIKIDRDGRPVSARAERQRGGALAFEVYDGPNSLGG